MSNHMKTSEYVVGKEVNCDHWLCTSTDNCCCVPCLSILCELLLKTKICIWLIFTQMPVQLYQSWRNKWITFDPVPLCTVSEMRIHLRGTILDCSSAMKDLTERAWSPGRCASSGGSVSDMMEQNDAIRWWNIMELHCCYQNGIAILISLCCYCNDLHVEDGRHCHLHMKGISTKGNLIRN